MHDKDINFSGYKTYESKLPIQTSFIHEMECIKSGDWKTDVDQARSIKELFGKDEYDKHRKGNVYCFTPGVNNSKYGKADPLPEDLTGLLTLDIDDLSQDQKRNKEILKSVPWVIAVGHSIGGVGLFAIIKCDKTRLDDSHTSAVRILADKGVKVAKGQANPNRLRYTSYDPDLYYSESPADAPDVPIIEMPKVVEKPLKPAQNNDREDIFKSILKIKSPESWQPGERHHHLTSVIGWCNHIGMSEDFCLEMAEKHCRPMMVDGKDYDIEIRVKDWYKRYQDQFATKEWNERNPHPIVDLDQFEVNAEMNIPDTPAIIKFHSQKVATKKDLTSITAETKGGKTSLVGVLLAGAISHNGFLMDGFPGIEVLENRDGKAVLHFDSEQTKYDQQGMLKVILKRAQFTKTPPYYRGYNMRTIDLNQYRDFTYDACLKANERFGGIHLIVIDGAADYVSSINDEPETTAIIKFFTKLADDFDCPVILVIHLNEKAGMNGDSTPRGHLGKQALRKGYAQINITKKGDVSFAQVLRARKAGEGNPIAYKYDPDKKYHVSVDPEDIQDEKTKMKYDAKKIKFRSIAEKILIPPKTLKHKDLVKAWMKAKGVEVAQSKRDITEMVYMDIIKADEIDNYRLLVS
jgi:AAA domain/VirE N-terminal domain